MKNTFYLIAAYLLICIGGAFVCAVMYMIYGDCTCLVAGSPSSLLSLYYFLKGFLLAVPICAALAPYFLILYIVRHSKKIISPLITLCVLSIFSFFVLIPCFINLNTYYETSFTNNKQQEKLSEGFFREDNSCVYYYTNVYNDNTADGIEYPMENLDFSLEQTKILKKEEIHKFDSEPFADILIKDTLSVPPLVKSFVSSVLDFYNILITVLKRGYAHWLCFCSIVFALVSTFAFVRATGWRLLNVLFICLSTVGIFIFNYLSYCTDMFSQISNFMHRTLPFTVSLYYPVPFCGNIIITIVFAVLGIIFFSVSKNRTDEVAAI